MAKKSKKGWLDKFDNEAQLGDSVYPVNYVPQAQNGIEGTMGGLTDKGFNYNGAWGGPSMQMGGSLPGASGMMYARTGAPSNGKYAKKTMASAQDGTKVSKGKKTLILAESDPDEWSQQTQVNEYGKNPFMTEAESIKKYVNKYFPGESVEIIPTYKHNIEDALGKSDPNTRLVVMGHHGDNMFGIPSDEFVNSVSNTKYENCYAGICYGDDLPGIKKPNYVDYVRGSNRLDPSLNEPGKKVPGRYPESYNLRNFNLRTNHIPWIGFAPVDRGGEEGFRDSFFRRTQNPELTKLQKLRESIFNSVGTESFAEKLEKAKPIDDKIYDILHSTNRFVNLPKAADTKELDYVPYPARTYQYPQSSGLFNPQQVVSKFGEGGEMKYYQEGLDWNPKNISQDGTYVKKPRTDMLTMAEYQKQQEEANKKRLFEQAASKAATMQSPSSLPKMSKQQVYDLNKQYAQQAGRSFNSTTGAVEPLVSANTERTMNRAMENIVEPMVDIEMVMSGAPLIGKGLQAAGKFLTEQTALKNAYKINPWAFKPNPEAYYRMLGKEGYDDALKSGVIRPPQKQFGFENAYYSAGFPRDINYRNLTGKGGYEGPYMAEVTNNPEYFAPLEPWFPGDPLDITYSTRNIPIDKQGVKFYKEDWLRGYKPVEVPKPASVSSSVEGVSGGTESGIRLNELLPKETPISTRALASDVTITDEGNRIVNRLNSPEGRSRLKNQFKIADPSLNDDQLNYLVQTRIDEVATAVNYNKSRFFTDFGKGASGTPTQNVPFTEYLPMENAHFSEINLFPGIRNLDAPVDLFPRRATPPPLPNVSSSRLNLSKPTIDEHVKAFTNPNYRPGSIALGTGLELNKNVLAHEVMHAIQSGGITPVDVDLLNLMKPKNSADMIWRAGVRLNPELKGNLKYFTTSGGRHAPSEPYPFLEELRNRMLNRGIIKDDYEKITPWKLVKARLDATKQIDKNFVEGTRLIKFTPPWKYGKLADIMNVAPAAVPVAGAAALMNREGKYEEGGEIPQAQFGIQGILPTPQQYQKFAENVGEFLSIPQKAITSLFSGKYQTPSEAMGIKNPVGAFLTDAVLDPTNLVGAGVVGKAAGKAVKASKESGTLSKAYKLNPWRFKPNPEAYYHRSPNVENIINKEKGILQGFGESEAGRKFTEDVYNKKLSFGEVSILNLRKGANSRLYFSKGTPLDWGRTNMRLDEETGKMFSGQGYKGPYIVEVKDVPMGSSTKGRAPGAEPTKIGSYAVSKRPINIDEAKFYKEDWLRGYKEVNPKKKKEGGVIKDDMGQWAHPGEITEIDSPYITMEGVPYPVLGVSDTGDTKMMYPGEDYEFDGEKVTEYPMAQKGKTANKKKNGGWLEKWK